MNLAEELDRSIGDGLTYRPVVEPMLCRDAPIALDLAGSVVTLGGMIAKGTIENPRGLAPPGFTLGAGTRTNSAIVLARETRLRSQRG